MEKLNKYCLEEIMSYLNLRDKTNFGATSEQIRHIFVQWAQRYLKAVKCDMKNAMTIDEEKTLIRLAGNNFQEYQMGHDVLDELAKYCKKLKRLEWTRRPFIAESHLKVLKLLDLETLECFTYKDILLFVNVKSIETSNYMTEFLLQTLTKLPKLQSLSLHCNAYKGKYLDTLTQIENLQLIDGSNILHEHFTSACENMSNLRILNLAWSSQSCKINVDYQRLLAISYCKNLEKLYLSFAVGGLEVLFDLPKLKCLGIEETNLFNSLQTLAAKKGDSLECLKLINTTASPGYVNHIGKMRALRELKCKLEPNQVEKLTELKQLENLILKCEQLNNGQALRIIEMCPKLLYFEVNCMKLTESFFTEAEIILQSHKTNGLRGNEKLQMCLLMEQRHIFKKIAGKNHIIKLKYVGWDELLEKSTNNSFWEDV